MSDEADDKLGPARRAHIHDMARTLFHGESSTTAERLRKAVDWAASEGYTKGKVDALCDPRHALRRLRGTVEQFMNGVASTAPHCETVDALDWVLQQIDKESEGADDGHR